MDTLYMVLETASYVIGAACAVCAALTWSHNIVMGTLCIIAAIWCLCVGFWATYKLKVLRLQAKQAKDKKKQAALEKLQQQITDNTILEAHHIRFFDRESSAKCEKRFIAICTSTTGLDLGQDRIIELAAIVFEDGSPTQRFSMLVNPGHPISAEVAQRTGITNEMLQSAPHEKRALLDFIRFLGDAAVGSTILVAHKASFHIDFIRLALARIEFPAEFTYMDTLFLSETSLEDADDLEDYKLTTLAAHFGIDLDPAQRAEGRAEACGRIFVELLHL